MPGMTLGGMANHLIEEKVCNKRLSQKLKNERAEHARILSEQRHAIKELQKQVRHLTNRLKVTEAQDEDLLQLRTENASLTDSLERARCVCQGGSGVRRCKKLARLRKVTDDSD